MQDKETINLLINRLLAKDDEILRLRGKLDRLREEQREGNGLILRKLDKALEELKVMRTDNQRLARQLSKALKDKSEALEAKSEALRKIEVLSEALESLQATRADELLELSHRKKQLYGRKSEKTSLLSKKEEKNLEEEKDEFDGTPHPQEPFRGVGSTPAHTDPPTENKQKNRPGRTDYSKNATRIETTVMHYCDRESIPEGARQIDVRHWKLYKLEWTVTEHIFEIVRVADKQGNITNVYNAKDKDDPVRPMENVLPGYHTDMELIAQIIVDKYQYGIALEQVVDRFKDAGAAFSPSTVLNWVTRHVKLLAPLEEPLRELLLCAGSFLFCDETTELVRVRNESEGKWEYRKKYIWGIKNPALKVACYLYDNGSRSKKVAENFFRDFFGSITTDGYNVYKLFDAQNSRVTRYGCMVHVRRKYVEALQTDSRAAEILNLISELYWIESDCKIHLLGENERKERRQKQAVPILAEIWQKVKEVYEQTKKNAPNLFIKAVRYTVNEWKALCRYASNGKAEIDNNTAERMMKPVCIGRNNYLFCGSERAAKDTALIYSIIETCKLNGIRPVKYIKEVLTKIVQGNKDYKALLPVYIYKKD